jgi:hypothetical protein
MLETILSYVYVVGCNTIKRSPHQFYVEKVVKRRTTGKVRKKVSKPPSGDFDPATVTLTSVVHRMYQ